MTRSCCSALFFAFIVCAFVLYPSTSSASTTTSLGNNFSCLGTKIIYGKKTVTVAQAKAKINAAIATLKKQLGNTTNKSKIKSLKKKIASEKATLAQLKPCVNGDFTVVDPIFSSLSGSPFSGTYTLSSSLIGTVNGTMNVTFTLSKTSFSASVGFDSLMQTLVKGPLNFSEDVGGITFPAEIKILGTNAGDITLYIYQDGRVILSNSGSSVISFDFEGTFQANSISGSITGSYQGFPFSGQFSISR